MGRGTDCMGSHRPLVFSRNKMGNLATFPVRENMIRQMFQRITVALIGRIDWGWGRGVAVRE